MSQHFLNPVWVRFLALATRFLTQDLLLLYKYKFVFLIMLFKKHKRQLSDSWVHVVSQLAELLNRICRTNTCRSGPGCEQTWLGRLLQECSWRRGRSCEQSAHSTSSPGSSQLQLGTMNECSPQPAVRACVSGILLRHGAGPASGKKELEQFWLAGRRLWLPRPELGLVGTFPGHPPWGIPCRPSPGLPQWRREGTEPQRYLPLGGISWNTALLLGCYKHPCNTYVTAYSSFSVFWVLKNSVKSCTIEVCIERVCGFKKQESKHPRLYSRWRDHWQPVLHMETSDCLHSHDPSRNFRYPDFCGQCTLLFFLVSLSIFL